MTKKMMSKTGLKILKTLIVVDMILLLVSVLFFNTTIMWNTQIAFISSSLVMIASLLAYRRMVKKRVEDNVITIDDSKDVIDRLEDPYDLYSEDEIEEEKDVVKVVKEERKKMKDNRSILQKFKDTKASLSLYRLGAYMVLVLGFLYLNRHHMLYIPAYILALGIPPIVIVTLLLKEKEKETL